MAPEISVVIPVKDGAGSMPALMDSVMGQDLDAARYEVIVVDNASRDDTAAIARDRGARVVHEPVPNRSRARNAGVAAARADVIAFIDGDCSASRGWLSALLACRGIAPLVAGPVHIETRTPPSAIERFEAWTRFDQQAWVEQGWAATANLMVEREAFDAVGGLDPAYRHIGEDADFCLRAGRAGFGLAFCPDALVHHEAEREWGPVIRRAYRHGYSTTQSMRRIGVGHVAWRHPRPLVDPRAALTWHSVPADGMPSAERRRQAAIASVAYASRVAGSVWSTLVRAR